VVHPLTMSEAELMAWGEVFADYEIIPPFQQLDRTVYSLAGLDAKATSIDLGGSGKLSPYSVHGFADKGGWRRGTPQDGGCYFEYTKYYVGAKVTAVMVLGRVQHQIAKVGGLAAGDIQRQTVLVTKDDQFYRRLCLGNG
jgi:hypothetical protein